MKRLAKLISVTLMVTVVFAGCSKVEEVSQEETQISSEETMCTNEETGTTEDEIEETTKQEETSEQEEITKQEETELETEAETENEVQTESKKETQTEQKVDIKEEETITVGEKDSSKLVYDTNSTANSDSESMKLAKAVIAKIIKSGMSDFEKAKAIHDYMIINIDYDFDDYAKGTIPYESYNVIGALKNKYAVCAGYAKTFKLLCELVDLECTYVTGKARGYHAWNQVKIDGKWYNVDVTWDDPVSEGKEFDNHYYNNYNYFLVSDEQFSDHTPNGSVHKCNNSLRKNAYEAGIPWAKDNFIRNKEELKTAIQKVVDANSNEIFLIWNLDWTDMNGMKSEVSNAMFELNVEPTYKFGRISYSKYKCNQYIRVKFEMVLENGKYKKLNKSATIDELKKQILATNDQNKAIYMVKELANEKTYKSLIAWAYDEKDIYLYISTTGMVSDKVAFIKVWKTDISQKVNNAAKAYNISEVEKIVKEFAKDYSGDVKYITYFYEKDFSGKEWNEVKEYIYEKSKEWKEKYCVEYDVAETLPEINRVTISLTEGHHLCGAYAEVRKASCTKTSLWQQRCTKCNYIIDEIEYETNGVHDAYWEYLSDTSRRIKCRECDYVGAVETKIGDIWGYYDEQKTEELFNLINERRLSAIYYNIDDWGNIISIETPPQFTYDESLALKSRESIIDIINRDFEFSDVYVQKMMWVKGYDNVQMACSMLLDNVSGRNVMNEKTYDIVGIACFSYDEDGTGLNNKTMWCVYFGKNTN